MTFDDLRGARGAPLNDRFPEELVAKWMDAGLVSTDSAVQQFTNVFRAKSSEPIENELLHVITSYTCNLTCSYCFMLADLAEGKKKVLTFDDARRGIDFVLWSSAQEGQRNPLLRW